MRRLTEARLLSDLARQPGGHARKPHYWLKQDTRAIYIVVWRAWFRGLVTCPLFDMALTDLGRSAAQSEEKK